MHRDLKPANIKLTRDGGVKVLDFGLAKPVTRQDDGETGMMTEGFAVMGTPAYMSPEQAKGQPVDKRTDIWAFGCVLYELLSGRRAFAGDSVTDTVVELMSKDPDWSAIPHGTPPGIVALVQRCLQKDPRNRLRDIGDAHVELEMTSAHTQPASLTKTTERARFSQWMMPVMLTVAAFAGGVLADKFFWTRTGVTNAVAPVVRSVLELPADALLPLGTHTPLIGFDSSLLAMSPDGTRLAYVAQSGSDTSLYIRGCREKRMDEWLLRSRQAAAPGSAGSGF